MPIDWTAGWVKSKNRIDEHTKSTTFVFVRQREDSLEFSLELLLGSKPSLATESPYYEETV